MQRPRPASCIAVRKSEVVKIQKASYKTLAAVYPSFAFSLIDVLRGMPSMMEHSMSVPWRLRSSRLRTIAIVPLSIDIPVADFTSMLTESVARINILPREKIFCVDSVSILESMEADLEGTAGNLHMENYLQQLQENVELLLLTADYYAPSKWNKICISNV